MNPIERVALQAGAGGFLICKKNDDGCSLHAQATMSGPPVPGIPIEKLGFRGLIAQLHVIIVRHPELDIVLKRVGTDEEVSLDLNRADSRQNEAAFNSGKTFIFRVVDA